MKATLQPAAIFGDHMVLRRDQPACIFGAAENGATVTAEIGSHRGCAVAHGGRFELKLPPMPAGGPYTLSLTDGQTTLRYADVLFGEVYFAGGQSNMELELKDSDDGARLTAETNNLMVRYYNVPKQPVMNAELLAAEEQAGWRALALGRCGDISAVAYHFATRLQAELGVPVGVIDCYWGGTSVACWLDEGALRQTAEGTALLTEFNTTVAVKGVAACEADVRAHDAAMEAWNRRVEALKAERPGAPAAEIYTLAGPCPWNPPAAPTSPFRPAGLVETMVKRVTPYTLSGFLYYQGEEDTKHPGLYLALMTTLISFWRRLFHDETLPFLFVQLPMFQNSGEADDHSWALLREAQRQTCRQTRRAGLAVMIDGGELDNIHPTDKKTVGERLFWEAMRVAYGRADMPEAPAALYAWREGSVLNVQLTAPVVARGEPALFELADDSGVFTQAHAEMDGARLRLTAQGMGMPVTARYAWTNYAKVNVFGTNGLPLAPFCID